MMQLIPPKSRRAPRILGKRGEPAHYHVVSRVVDRTFRLTDADKEAFRGLLRRVAEFCGVHVLTYAILDNHFHLLLEVPASPGDPDDEELRRRGRLLYGKERKRQPLSFFRIDRALEAGGEIRDQMRALLIGRMASLPMFVKILKQRFSIIYNRKHDRLGTLWEDRFHSVLVEDSGAALTAVAAYIDLNPVRAGIVQDPKDYRFSGYGEAAGTQRGFAQFPLFVRLAADYAESTGQIATLYRRRLFISGSNPGKGGVVSKAALTRVLRQDGKLPASESLYCRLRYMTQGAVIGSKAFIQEWIAENKSIYFPKRPKKPKPLVFSEDAATLCSLR
ncbi:MAG: transposase [Opitutales bacterium]|nr:transposase [Opitutales bacterium]